jgi:hypothetical protein
MAAPGLACARTFAKDVKEVATAAKRRTVRRSCLIVAVS